LERWWERVSAQNSASQADRLRAHLIVFAVRDHLDSEQLAAQLHDAFTDFEMHLTSAPRGRDGVEAARSALLTATYAAMRQVRRLAAMPTPEQPE